MALDDTCPVTAQHCAHPRHHPGATQNHFGNVMHLMTMLQVSYRFVCQKEAFAHTCFLEIAQMQ